MVELERFAMMGVVGEMFGNANPSDSKLVEEEDFICQSIVAFLNRESWLCQSIVAFIKSEFWLI